jgi:hypothetical protein
VDEHLPAEREAGAEQLSWVERTHVSRKQICETLRMRGHSASARRRTSGQRSIDNIMSAMNAGRKPIERCAFE